MSEQINAEIIAKLTERRAAHQNDATNPSSTNNLWPLTLAEFKEAHEVGLRDFTNCYFVTATADEKPPIEQNLPMSDHIENVYFGFTDFSHADLSAMTFTHCSFTHCKFIETNMHGVTLNDCAMQSAVFIKTEMRDSEVLKCQCSQVVFTEARLDRTKFSQSVLSNSRFTGCVLEGVKFFGADLSGVMIHGGAADRCDFLNAKIEWMEFRPVSSYNVKSLIALYVPDASSRGDTLYAVKHGTPDETVIMCKTGCFWGTVDEFRERVLATHGTKAIYLPMIDLIKTVWAHEPEFTE